MKQQDDVVMPESGILNVWNKRQEKLNRHARRELKAIGLVPDPESHAGWVPGTVRYFNRHQSEVCDHLYNVVQDYPEVCQCSKCGDVEIM